MFTGIIEATAKVLKRDKKGLLVERPSKFDDIAVGASIAISGVCLSIVSFDALSMRFDVIQETWNRTMLDSLKKGDVVNLERALKADGRFDGHLVQGHVEGVGKIWLVEGNEETGKTLTLDFPSNLSKFIVDKGSISINGTSLTVVQKKEHNRCSISLIPHTLASTNLGQLVPGDAVNIETDILARYILSTQEL